MPDLDQLRSLSHHLWPPAYEEMVDVARRRDRRVVALVTTGVASAVAATLVVVMVVANPGRDGSRIDPAPPPKPAPSVTSVPPNEAASYAPDVSSDDLRRWEEIETVSNTDPDHKGATELRFEVTLQSPFTYRTSVFCSGDRNTWFVYYVGGDGASGSGFCDAPLPSTLPPLPTDVTPFGDSSTTPKTVEVRMFVVGPLLKQHRACLNQKSPPECLSVEPPLEPLVSTDVEFGISVYEHWAPAVAEVAGEAVGALTSIDGVDYVLSQVVQGPGDSALRLDLNPTGPERLVAVLEQASEAMVACGTAAGRDRKAEQRCHPSLELLIGSRRVALERGTFGAPGDFPRVSYGRPLYRVPAGTTGRIDLQVTRGQPENVNLAFLVFEAAE